jgi:hypothetical protein
MLVAASVAGGDAWSPQSPQDIGRWLELALSTEPWKSLNRNPFVPEPDFHALVDGGWARWIDKPIESRSGAKPIEFTDAGYARMIEKGWVQA